MSQDEDSQAFVTAGLPKAVSRPPDFAAKLPRHVGGLSIWMLGVPELPLEFLAAISDPPHPDHEEFLIWTDQPFDLDAFDVNDINAELAESFSSTINQA